MAAHGYDASSFIPCFVCGCKAVDIHHIIPRSKFGSKTKHIQDALNNLVALCRTHHELAHNDVEFNKSLKIKTGEYHLCI